MLSFFFSAPTPESLQNGTENSNGSTNGDSKDSTKENNNDSNKDSNKEKDSIKEDDDSSKDTNDKENKDTTNNDKKPLTNGPSSDDGDPKPFCDIPEKQRHQLKHRELFLSRQVETLPATHIRGKCVVTLLNETENLLSYLNKEVS